MNVLSKASQFQHDVEKKSFDQKHRSTIKFNIGKYNTAVTKGLGQYTNHELARSRGSYIKYFAIKSLDKRLLEFEQKFKANGGEVIWASTSQQALEAIGVIMKSAQARLVVKSKSMTTEEVHLNAFLEKNGIESFETDLGEYIVQLAGQRPYHIVTPAMHMSKVDIAELFAEKLKTKQDATAEELVAVARDLMRQKYIDADVGITGANFILPDIGGIAITENEGNGRLSFSFPKIHIAIVGIEKVVNKLDDLQIMWPLLATSGTGQQVTVYNSIITGPRQSSESDGPEKMYVILLDNGRTNLLADPEKRQALHCIRCGACLNACPVYKNIGGHSYESTYSGPIGSVITPHLEGMADFKHLSYASSLCGACTQVCPVRIDIHNLLLLNRKESVEKHLTPMLERQSFGFWKLAMKNRWMLNIANSWLKNWVFKFAFGKTWGKRRENLNLAPKTFNDLWKVRSDNKHR